MNTDILIIGGGVVGTAIAKELSRYKLNIVLVEKEADVACGTSKVIAGGLIREREEIDKLLKEGVMSVSTSNQDLWNYKK